MNDPSPDLITDANIHQQLNESKLSYSELFRRLDKNHDGRIEVDQLIELLDKVGVEISPKKRWALVRVSVFFTGKII
jgi:Ca2+-binding EF-hand superfamily protein